jgi:acylpyruvate hydrolase
MKLVTFLVSGNSRIGAVVEKEQIIDLNYAFQAQLKREGKARFKEIAEAHIPAKMELFLQGGEDSLKYAKSVVQFALENPSSFDYPLVYQKRDVKVDAPLRNPGKIVCVGHNYREHILEMGRELPSHPVIFAKFANTIIGPEDDIPFYPISEQLDYEAEFAFVIGKRAKNISEEDALHYVAGYTIANDVTYRDIQRRTLQWLQGKTVDGSAPMGPWLVTSDELTDPSGLEIVLSVNGEERQRSNTANLVFTVQKLVAFLSNLMTLEPGDIVLTGTPGGVGVAMNPPVFLKEGDVVRIEVDKIGVLENRVRISMQNLKVKSYIDSIQTSLDNILLTVKDLSVDEIRWKPSENEWSILQILSHIGEATLFWLGELDQVLEKPGSEWGRGLDDPARLAAVENPEQLDVQQVIEKVQQLKGAVREKLSGVSDDRLSEQNPHRNFAKFGNKSVSFLIEHFLVDHINGHLEQINRNLSKLNKNF